MTTPYCHVCGSHSLSVTSSQQMRRVEGKQKLHAEAICDECANVWWSRHPGILRLARAADRARKQTA